VYPPPPSGSDLDGFGAVEYNRSIGTECLCNHHQCIRGGKQTERKGEHGCDGFYHRRVDASEFRDHWADTEAEWSHAGAWLTSFVLPPSVVCDAVGSVVGHIDLPFLVPVPVAAMHITVEGVSRRPDSIEGRLPQLLDAVKDDLANLDAFDATLAEPVVGYGGVF
jgi:hypothetical protein